MRGSYYRNLIFIAGSVGGNLNMDWTSTGVYTKSTVNLKKKHIGRATYENNITTDYPYTIRHPLYKCTIKPEA